MDFSQMNPHTRQFDTRSQKNSSKFFARKKQRGSAIMFSLFLMSLLLFIAFEVSYDSVVEYQNSLNAVRKVQAYHSARACTSLSLLRIKAFQQASRAGIAKSLPSPTLLDLVWQFPLSWPLPVPAGLTESDKDSIKKTTKTSTFKHQFSSQITSESGRIDINDLASPSQGLRDKTKQQIYDLFQAKIREQGDFSKKYQSFDFKKLINNIADWVDADKDSQNGGDEGSYYSEMRNPYLPPNEPFKTFEELHMVTMMEDDIFNVLAPAITLYGGKGININYADSDLLMSLDPRMTKDVVDQIMKRRNDPNLGGPFRDDKDFYGFLSGFGISAQNFNEQKVPLYFDNEINFKISCIGVVGKVSTEITTVVYDYQKVQSRLSSQIALDPNNQNPQAQAQASTLQTQCQGKTGNDKYNCLCQNKTIPADKQKCITDQQAADQKGQGQSTDAPLPPGPPYIIFQDVR